MTNKRNLRAIFVGVCGYSLAQMFSDQQRWHHQWVWREWKLLGFALPIWIKSHWEWDAGSCSVSVPVSLKLGQARGLPLGTRETVYQTLPVSLFFTQKASSPFGFPFIFPLLSSFFLLSFLFSLPLSTFVFLFYIFTSYFFPRSLWLRIAPFSKTHLSPALLL